MSEGDSFYRLLQHRYKRPEAFYHFGEIPDRENAPALIPAFSFPEREINSGSVFVENKLDHAKGKGHVIQYGETCTDIGGCNFGKLMTQSFV